MAEILMTLEGDTYEAFERAFREIAAEKGIPEEDAMKAMRKLNYLFVTRT